MFQTYSKLCLASSTPPPPHDKIIHSSETFPRLHGARSIIASLAAATCNDATVYHAPFRHRYVAASSHALA